MKPIALGVVGATGLVGRMFLEVLEERDFPIKDLYLFASKRSAGKKLSFKGRDYQVEELTAESFKREMDIALFSAGGEVSRKFAPIAAACGVTVVDNSSAWRMDPTVPLVVPEVNPEALKGHHGIIANPNCSTITAILPLKALDEAFGLERVVYSTYQSVSGSGLGGMQDLERGLAGEPPLKYPHPIAFNCLPHIDVFMDNGYTKEEMKMVNESRKILDRPDLRVTATAVRVPVRYAHSISVNVQLKHDFTLDQVYACLEQMPGVVVQDNPAEQVYPLAIEAKGKDSVFVGRVRRDFSLPYGLNFWCVADNLRKGAATNAVQIAEQLLLSSQV